MCIYSDGSDLSEESKHSARIGDCYLFVRVCVCVCVSVCVCVCVVVCGLLAAAAVLCCVACVSWLRWLDTVTKVSPLHWEAKQNQLVVL